MKFLLCALLAGSAFFGFGWGRVKEGVRVNGIDVGGLSYHCAEELLKKEVYARLPPLVIHAPKGDLVVQEELSPGDDLDRLLRRARRGESLLLPCTRNWANAEDKLYALCRVNARDAENAELEVTPSGFSYLPETTGIACDYHALLRDVLRALQTGEEVTLGCEEYAPEVTVRELRAQTAELSSARTYFDGSNAPRRHNIALAAARISGTAIAPHAEFSFNRTVGERTAENGFRVAAVISEGEFVPGVGGGVCQASTTLYLAALSAGLQITEARAHSLSVGYAPPSLDAMVSECSDLRFVNPYDMPVYLFSEVSHDSIRFRICGLPDGRIYRAESVVLERIPPPAPEEAEEGQPPKAEKEGIKSESYLSVFEGETLISRTRLRKDSYAAVRGRVPPEKPEDPFKESPGERPSEGEP